MNLRATVDRMLEDLNPTERAILARRFAALRASWRGRLEAIATARSSSTLEAPISARDRHRIRRLFRPLVLELEARARHMRTDFQFRGMSADKFFQSRRGSR